MTKEQISNQIKAQIADDLALYVQVQAGGSANKASKQLIKVSNGTISNLINRKWDNISDDMWRNVQKQVSSPIDGEWKIVATKNLNTLTALFEDAASYANTYGVIADAGTGKTAAADDFKVRPNTFVVKCNEFFNRKVFLQELLREMGLDYGGYTTSEMMFTILDAIRKADKPLIILDEADKLSDPVLYFFISLYNSLEGQCGLVLMATDFLKKRIERGVRLNKKGYKEIFSRLGRRFIAIPVTTDKDIKNIILANGIFDEIVIAEIINGCESDLRRVKRLVHSQKRKEAKSAA